jgi:hypothetical protein
MKTGKSIVTLAAELARRRLNRRDFVADTRTLTMQEDGSFALDLNGAGPELFTATEHAHRQVGTRLGIPAKYYDRMRTDLPALLRDNVNGWMHSDEHAERRMVRTLDGTMRAFLSDKYRRFDDEQVAEIAIPVLAEHPDMVVESCEITERRLYIQARFPRIEGKAVGDTVQAGVIISNSEIGQGRTKVERLVYTLSCTNGMIAPGAGTQRNHVGRTNGVEDEAFEMYQDDTLEADDQAFALKLRDTIRAAADEVSFRLLAARMEAAHEQKIEVPAVKAVEVLSAVRQLTEGEGHSVLEHLIRGGDMSRYGLLNAVTRAAQDVESYDRAVDLERLGGRIMDDTALVQEINAASLN